MPFLVVIGVVFAGAVAALVSVVRERRDRDGGG